MCSWSWQCNGINRQYTGKQKKTRTTGQCHEEANRLLRSRTSGWGAIRREKRFGLGYFYVMIHCINHVFLSYIRNVLTCWGFAGPGEIVSSQSRLIPRDNKQCPWACTFYMQTNQYRAHIANHLL